MRRLFILIFFAVPSLANVCTPLNVPANGPFPAVVNGLDGLDWGVVRVQWTADATPSSPVTQIKILYADAAHWGGNSDPRSYPYTQGIYGSSPGNINITDSRTIQGGILSNLSPNTTYHVIGQSLQGSAWCTATDATFTTPSKPEAAPVPMLPAKVDVTQPSMTGTHWVYGSNCGAAKGNDAVTVTANWQDCLNRARPGDDIAAAPGTYPVLLLTLPNSPNAVAISCAPSTSRCTQSGTPPSNGTTAIFYQPPAPINPGVQYKIVNVSGSTFQISFDGVSPIQFKNAGGDRVFYMEYPLKQPYITIHPTTYGKSLLPPSGVRLGSDSVKQYLPHMINFEDMDPTFADGFLAYQFMASGYWWQNVAFSTDPNVALTTGHEYGLDPQGYRVPMGLGGNFASQNFVFNQCAFLFSLPPSRSGLVPVAGGNIAVINSYQQGLDWWQGHLAIPDGAPIVNTKDSITFPSMTASWVTAGGSVGKKRQCVNHGGTWTITGGSTTGAAAIWIRPSDCSLVVQATPGLTVRTSGHLENAPGVAAPSVTNVGTPGNAKYSYLITATDAHGSEITAAGAHYIGAFLGGIGETSTGNPVLSKSSYNHLVWQPLSGAAAYNVYRVTAAGKEFPSNRGEVLLANTTGLSYDDTGGFKVDGLWSMPVYWYTSPTGAHNIGATVFPIGTLAVTNGAITATNIGNSGASMAYPTFEVNTGFAIGASVGPYLFDNNYMTCTGVCGVFMTDDITDDTTPCSRYSGTPCPLQHNPGDLTETRSTITTNPCYFYDSPCWNGGNYYFRNGTEVKQGKRILQDGNQYGPFYAQVGFGECALHETYNGGAGGIGAPFVYTGYPSYADSSEWTFTNNTCNGTGQQLITGFKNNILTGYANKNFLVRNNLFINGNEYALTPLNQAAYSARVYRENRDGNCPGGSFSNWAGSGQNIVFDHNTIWGTGGCLPVYLGFDGSLSSGLSYTNSIFNVVLDPGVFGSYKGSIYQANNSTDTCNFNQGKALIDCFNLHTFQSNILLATYTNSMPGSEVEFTKKQIRQIQATNPKPPEAYWPDADTLAGRLEQIGWFSAPNSNFRIKSSSPYISGGKLSTDGLDIGVNVDELEQHQGKVSNVRALAAAETSTDIAFYAPDSFACSVDWGTSAFFNGDGKWTRVTGSPGSPDPRVQIVNLKDLPQHGLIYYRVNCAVEQPTGSVQLP